MRIDCNSAAKKLFGAQDILILTHLSPDGDTVGSASGLCLALREKGRRAFVYRNPEFTEKQLPFVDGLFPPEDFSPGFVAAVDCASPGMLCTDAYPVDLLVDHHTGNEEYARFSYLDVTAAAVGVMALDLVACSGVRLTARIATRLYLALSTDTGCFRYANTDARAFSAAARLSAAGADIATVNHEFFEVKTARRIALEREIYATMRFFPERRAAAAVLPFALIASLGIGEHELEDVANIPYNVEGVSVGITLREKEDGSYKVSLRTDGSVDAAAACRKLGGGGHVRAAGARVEGGLEKAIATVLEAVADA